MEWNRGRILGCGSSATVSLATVLPSGDVFAVKSVEFSRSELLQREQSILSSLNSSNIIGYKGYDIKEENGKIMYNLFMEYISGGTINDAILKQGRFDEPAIKFHTRGILKGLEYLHSNRLVHCDIKGRNILIGCDGTKIADLGCAKWIEEVPISGTPVFMAPEVARGEEQGFPSDVWSLGCTVIEMATGCPPWPEVADPVSALYKIAFSGEVPEFPRFLSEKAMDFLSKCLIRDPRERWTATQLLKHPFLSEPNSDSKQIHNSLSNSPTSILDQEFWDTIGDSQTPLNLFHNDFSDSPAENIRRLSGGILFSSTKLPNWTWEENWVTVRENNNEEGCLEDQNMIQFDEASTSRGSVTVSISSYEGEPEFYSSSVSVNNDLCDNSSFYKIISSSSSRKRRRERKGFLISCKHMKVDLVESEKISVLFFLQSCYNPISPTSVMGLTLCI